MKIAIVSEHVSPLSHVDLLARSLGAQGHRVTVYTRRDDPAMPDRLRPAAGVAVLHASAGPAKQISQDELLPWIPDFGRWLADRWEQDPPDIVHAHHWRSGLAALAGARDLDIPVVQTFHVLGSVKRRHEKGGDTSLDGRIDLEASIARSATAVIATSSDEVFELMRMGMPRQSAAVVPCGVDVERFTPEGPSARRGKRPRLLHLGCLAPRKGVDTIITALSRVPGAELLVAGGPSPETLDADPDVTRLREVAQRADVADRVKFLGRIKPQAAPALIRSVDLVVSVAWYEPSGLVALEAMACGVPIITSGVGSNVDTVINGVTGEHVPPRDPKVLARTIRRLLADATSRNAYGIAGADRACSRYSKERVANETLTVYQRVCRTRNPAAASAGGG